MLSRMNCSPLPIHTHHGDSRLRRGDTDDFISGHYQCLHPVRISSVNKGLLTTRPCNVTLIWHHSLKGTLNVERNADDSSDSPFI